MSEQNPGGNKRPSSRSRKVIPTTGKVVAAVPRKRPSVGVQVAVVLIGVVLFANAIGRLFTPEQRRAQVPGASGPTEGSAFGEDYFAIFGSDTPVAAKWENPDPSLLQKQFCSGGQYASNCTETTAHPFVKEFERAGWTPEEYEYYLGWSNTPTADDDRVVERTVVYNNKSFKLFGK